MIKILYDTQIFQKQRYGGISRYFKEILHCFAKSKELKYTIPFTFCESPFLEEIIAEKSPTNSKILKNLDSFFSHYKRWDRTRRKFNTLSDYILHLMLSYDIYHPTYYNPTFLEMSDNKPLVVTVHDMIHELFPQFYHPDDKTREWKKLLIHRATKIIAVSNNTKKDILRFHDVDDSKIKVIYHGNSLSYTRGPVPKLPDKYILFVGERIRYKNFPLFLTAIAKLLTRDSDQYLVCIGGGGITPGEAQLFSALNVTEKVICKSVSDSELSEIYARAQVFVYPSLYEGFGMPVLEAFACGCPVALSNTSSLPEIAADAAVYFDPSNEASIIESIEKVLDCGNLRRRLILSGYKRAQDFTWEKTAKETIDLYRTTGNC